MIFRSRLSTRSGNFTISTVLGVFGALTAYSLLQSGLNGIKNALGTNAETKLMMNAHSVANLLKMDINTNFTDKYTPAVTTGTNPWDKCKGPVDGANDFLVALSGAKTASTCNTATLDFSNFNLKGTTNPANGIAISALTATEFEPKVALNGYKQSFKITSFNTSVKRNSITADLTVSSDQMKVEKHLTMVIDVERTINPKNSTTAKLCRNIAGAVCDNEAAPLPKLDFYFLDSSGNVRSAALSGGVTNIGDPPVPPQESLAVSVKNVDTTRKVYRSDSFCVSAIQGNTPVLYIIDGAQDAFGKAYFLTVHGKLLDANGNDVWATPDPKFISLGNDNEFWFFLRSDGAVFQTSDITDQGSLVDSGLRLPTAIAIATGAGPEPCP